MNGQEGERDKIGSAKTDIENALKREVKGTEKYTFARFKSIKDWVPTELVERLQLKPVSLNRMFENGEIDFLMFGKAGDYIGENKPQTIPEILEEKVGDLAEKARCLWATSGPKMDIFSTFYSLFRKKYGEEKKLYVLFRLTINKYESMKPQKTYRWEKDGITYTDTAPDAKK